MRKIEDVNGLGVVTYEDQEFMITAVVVEAIDCHKTNQIVEKLMMTITNVEQSLTIKATPYMRIEAGAKLLNFLRSTATPMFINEISAKDK